MRRTSASNPARQYRIPSHIEFPDTGTTRCLRHVGRERPSHKSLARLLFGVEAVTMPETVYGLFWVLRDTYLSPDKVPVGPGLGRLSRKPNLKERIDGISRATLLRDCERQARSQVHIQSAC